jgi:hypothetical protein
MPFSRIFAKEKYLCGILVHVHAYIYIYIYIIDK